MLIGNKYMFFPVLFEFIIKFSPYYFAQDQWLSENPGLSDFLF